jgi:hypothetical protein
MLLSLALVAGGINRVQAQTTDLQFSLLISEKDLVLAHPDDMTMMKLAMWDTTFQRLADRNMPTIQLTNDSISDLPITEFHMTIGDTNFNFSNAFFGTFAKFKDDAGISDITSTGGDELVIKFGNGGLQAGDSVRFKIDLDVDAAFANQFYMHPDFRTVLFDMNGMNAYGGNGSGMSDNSVVTVLFGSNPGTPVSATMDEYSVSGPEANFFNQFHRGYGIMEGVQIFPLMGAASQNTEIPEPGALVMAMIALVGGLTYLRNRFDQQANSRHARTY